MPAYSGEVIARQVSTFYKQTTNNMVVCTMRLLMVGEIEDCDQ